MKLSETGKKTLYSHSLPIDWMYWRVYVGIRRITPYTLCSYRVNTLVTLYLWRLPPGFLTITPLPPPPLLRTDADIHCTDLGKVEESADQDENQFQGFRPKDHWQCRACCEELFGRWGSQTNWFECFWESHLGSENFSHWKAPGCDGISNSTIKNLFLNMLAILQIWFLQISIFGIFFFTWK